MLINNYDGASIAPMENINSKQQTILIGMFENVVSWFVRCGHAIDWICLLNKKPLVLSVSENGIVLILCELCMPEHAAFWTYSLIISQR